ncbi:MAG: hypothetical protein Q7J06_07550 [Bacteroidales bacterium]|nr:hypothetical protein [Bacteroidales bacterium]
MSVEEKLDEFVKQYKADRAKDKRDAGFYWHLNIAYIAWGFTIATLSLYLAKINPDATQINLFAVLFFLIIGFIEFARALCAKFHK